MAIKKITDPGERRILAEKIKAVEKALGVTGKEMARLCGVSDATIYRLEGRVESDAGVSERMLTKIANAAGIDKGWLLDSSASVYDVGLYMSGHIGNHHDQFCNSSTGRGMETTGSEGFAVTGAAGSYVTGGILENKGAYKSEIVGRAGRPERDGEKAGERIRGFRMQLGLTQSQFAIPLDITQGYLASIESGKAKLTEQMACKIEETYENAGAEWLLTGDERNRYSPVGARMVEWLKNHQRARETIKAWMNGEEQGEQKEQMNDA